MRRPKREDPQDNSDRWMVSYADFITLLFAFFVVLFATSQKDLSKGKEFEESIKKFLIKFGAFGESGQNVNQGVQENAPIEAPIKKYESVGKKVSELQYKVETYLEEKLSEKELQKLVGDISGEDFGVRISLRADRIFSGQSEKFKPEAVSSLQRLAKSFRSTPYKIFVEGHVSDRPIKNSKYSNAWDLAAGRAATITRYLIKVQGFDQKRLAAISYGSSRPLVPNTSIENQGRNERIDFFIVTEEGPL